MDADCVQWGVDPCPRSAINNGTMGPATMAMAPGLGDEDHPDGKAQRIHFFRRKSPSAIRKPCVGAAGRIAAWAAKTIASFAADGVGARGEELRPRPAELEQRAPARLGGPPAVRAELPRRVEPVLDQRPGHEHIRSQNISKTVSDSIQKGIGIH